MRRCQIVWNFQKPLKKFLYDYSFKDEEEIYTNGSELIQLFRVIQALEHYAPELLKEELNDKEC